MAKSYHLSPEVLEEIFIHTLDYSYQLNNLQLKRLQLVSIAFNGVATRLLYRWIVVSKGWSANRLYSTLIAKRDLRTLVRSISFVGNSALQPVREAKLLASLPLCTSFFSDSNDIMTIDSRGTYTPTYPTNERLVVITLCRIRRKALPRSPPPQGPGRHIPLYRPPNPPIYDENGVLVPLIKANSALDHLASLPAAFPRLIISGRNVEDFKHIEGKGVDHDFPLKRLASIEIFNIDIGVGRIWEILEPSMKSETLRSFRCHDAPVYIHEITLNLVRLWGSSLRELVLYTYEPHEGWEMKPVNLMYVFFSSVVTWFASSALTRDCPRIRTLDNLEVLALTEYGKETPWNLFPRNLRDLSIHKNNDRFRRSEILALVRSLSQQAFPNLDSFSITSERPAVPPRRSFPRSTPISLCPTLSTGLRKLRIEGLRIDGKALGAFIQYCAPTLRYLALVDLGILIPWAAISKCRSLRWLELGSINKLMNGDLDSDGLDEESDDDDDKRQEDPRAAEYAVRRKQAQVFLDTTFPHLDYLHFHLGDSFSLSDVANSIRRNQWPTVKVIDLEGLQKGGVHEDEDIEEENGTGLEELLEMSKSRGLTICAGGTPLQGLGDLWRYMLNRKGWDRTESDDDM
ncbi:hypothetical protein JCM5353_006504 [Sporobolomyces roseus]